MIRSIRSIEASDVCILMIDATRGIEGQDANIFGLIQRNRKGLVVCVNKWDLVEDKSVTAQKRYEAAIRSKFAPFTDFPIIFTSAPHQTAHIQGSGNSHRSIQQPAGAPYRHRSSTPTCSSRSRSLRRRATRVSS